MGEARRPNLLLILADQWRGQALPLAGDPNVRTPNLETLARGGVHFERAYTSNPACSPARASLLTGRFPHACGVPRNSVRLPVDEPSLSAELARAGYATGYIGKWHLDGEDKPGFVPPGPRRHGFQDWAAFNRGNRFFDSTYFADAPEPVRKTGFEPDYQTELAESFIARHKAGPFLLFLSWGPPHPPRTPPARWAQAYRARQLALRDNVPPDNESEARRDLAAYYAMCSALDENVGLLLGALDRHGLSQDTIVVFCSDHGDMLGSHGLTGKELPYEEAVRVPLLVRYPGQLEGGSKQDVLFSLVDLMPTLLGFCGLEAPQPVMGRDLSALIRSGEGERPESVYAEGLLGAPGEWRMLVRGLDKIVVDTRMNVTHLFNLGQDPFEQRNLAAEASSMRLRDELRALIRRWVMRTGDRIPRSGAR